jgi:integrase
VEGDQERSVVISGEQDQNDPCLYSPTMAKAKKATSKADVADAPEITRKRKPRARANGEGTIYERTRTRRSAGGKAVTTVVYVAELAYTDPQTHLLSRLSAQRATRAEALRELQRFRAQAADRTAAPVPREQRTVGEAFAAYFEDVALRVDPITVSTYRTIVEGHVLPTFRARRANSIVRSDVVRWMTDLRAEGVGDRTLQVAYQRLKAVVGPYVAMLPPADHPFPPRGGPKVSETEVKFWTEDDLRAFVAGVRGDPHEALYLLALTGGLRQSELLGLRWGDLDLKHGIVRVARSRSRATRTIKEPKSLAGRREVHIPPLILSAFERHREAQRKRKRPVERDDAIFTGPSGRTLSASAAYHGLQRVIERLNLPRVSFHSTRHTAATIMLHRGINLKVVQAVLGHADPALILRRYGHVIPGAQAMAASAMGDVLTGAAQVRSGSAVGEPGEMDVVEEPSPTRSRRPTNKATRAQKTTQKAGKTKKNRASARS